MSEFDDLLARVRSTESPLTPKTTNADDYSGLLARVRGGQDQTAAQASLNASVYTNPDLEGEKQRLAKELKNRFNEDWSPTAINVDEARRRLQTSTGADLMQNAPALAGRMVNSDFAKVAHDDIPILTATEYQAALLKREQRPSTYLEDIKDVSIKALQGVISGPQMVVGLADIQTGGWAGKMLEKLGYDPQEAKDILSTYYSESQQRAERKVQEAQGFVEKTKEALLNPRVIGGTIIESLASMLVGGVISKLLPFGTPLVRGAIGEGIVGAGSAAEQIRTGNEEGLLNLKETVSAVGSGVGTALFSLLGGRVAQKLGIDDVDTLMATKGATPATNKMVGRRVLESMFSEGILEEMPQSMQEQMWQNYAEDKPIFEDVDQAGVLGMFAGMAMGGGTQLLGLPSEWKRDRAKAETAKENASALARIAELAAESKLRERNPDQYESLVQDQFQGSNAENIYIDGQQLANVLNQGGMTKEQLALTLPEVASQIDQAIATGGDVIIPTAKFAARLATTDVGKALIEHARMDPDDISKAEAGVVDEKKNEMLDAAKKQQREKQMQSEEFIKSAKEVEGLMLEQVKQTKQYPDTVARTYAQFVRDFVVTQSASLNMQPMDYYNKYMYKVEAAGAQAADTFDQAGKLVTETPNFKNWFKESKVVDDQGKPLIMYHGTDADFATFRPNHRGAYFLTPNAEFASDYTTTSLETLEEKGGSPNIMPVYVRAENPFDYENPEHVAQVIEYLHKTGLFRGIQPGWFEGGRWENVEDRSVQKAIKALGFDSFYAYEYGEKNLGVYSPSQIKSAIGNNGEFNPENPSILRQAENKEPAIDVEEDAQADDVAPITQSAIPEGVDQAAILENALKIANSKIWNKGRELKVALQTGLQELAKAAGVDVSAPSEQTSDYLVRVGIKDALFALQQNANAIGWYDEKTRQALAVMALIHPEIATNENAKFAFVWALATTSNGMKVDKNFELAEQAYSHYKANKVMPTDLKAGQAQGAINDALGLFNTLVKDWGIDNLRQFMLTNYTVGEIAAIARDLKPGGEHADTQVKGASIIGPKIGNGFFSNLYGNFDALTMDRWLVRTWGRWTGTLIKSMPVQEAKAKNRLNAAIKAIKGDELTRLNDIVGVDINSTEIDVLSVAIQEASMDPDKRAQLNESAVGVELRKAGNSLAKYLDGQKEAPAGPHERTYIRSIFASILDEVKQNPAYADLTMADLQAVLWYAEKRLYETAKEDIPVDEESTEGYSDEDAPDYANAAAAVAREKGVSEKKIANALKKESKDERSRRARLQNEPEAQPQGQPAAAGGFTETAKRLFSGAVATRTARANRVGDEKQSWSYSGRGRTDGGKPRVLKNLGISYLEQWKAGPALGRIYRANGIATPAFYELAPSAQNATKFAEAITASKQNSGKVGAAVYVYPAEDYAGMRLFMAEDGKSGVAIKPDGDIVSVFSSGGAGRSVMELAVAAGGIKLDAFETILPEFYAAHGFVASSRLTWSDEEAPPDWDKEAFAKFNGGKPDVVFMALDDSYTGWHKKTDGKRFTDYGDAVAEQGRAVKRNQKQRKQTAGVLKQAEQLTPEERSRAQAAAKAGVLEQPARGGFDPKRLTTIINEKSDYSTFLHETAHFFLTVYSDMAVQANVTEQMKADMQTVLDWFGVKDIETWNAMSLEEQRKYHEQFAYNYEIYLFEGKAPSLKMQGLFDKFSAWLRRVYISIRDDLNLLYKAEHGTDLPILTGEVRQVMDRMVASADQIKQAEQIRNMAPIYQTQEESGMNDGEWTAYQEMLKEASDSAVTDLTMVSMRQVKWLSNARSKLIKEMQKKTDGIRKGIRSEVETEIQNQPIYRAINWLKRGEMTTEDGSPIKVEAGNKLAIADVKALYPESTSTLIDRPDITKLGYGKYGMLAEEGLHPDLVASMFGLPSGDALVRGLLDAKPIKEAIDERTDERMLEEHSELSDPKAMELEVEKALHNEARARFVAVELRHLAKATQPVRVMLQAAKAAAKQIISGKVISEVRPRDYSIAEGRAARQAMDHMKKGESQEAAKAKQNQLVQNQLAAEAVAARQEIQKALDGFKKIFKADEKLAKSRNMDLVDAARSILAYHGLGQKGKSPVEYIEKLRAYNPDMYAEIEPLIIRAASGSQMYTDLTVDEFRLMRDTVEALWFQSKREKEIRIEGQLVSLDQVTSELNARLKQVGLPVETPGQKMAPGKKERAVRSFFDVKAITRRVEHWADALDGIKGPSAFTKYIWRPVKDALDGYRIDRNNFVKRYVDMIAALDLPVIKIESTELDYTFGNDNGGIGKAELLGALLHTGNESNYKKLLVGREWGTLRPDGSLDDSRWKAFEARMIEEGKLTKADYDFVQQVWDLNEEMKPLAQEAHKEIFGYYFKEVQATPLVTPFGAYRGGYVPAKTDSFIVRDAQRNSKMEELESDFRQSMPSTGMGFTKGRVEYNKPLALDIRKMAKHIDDVIRFAHVQPVIKDVLRILRRNEFADNLTKLDPTAIEGMLIPWLIRSARQITSEPGKYAGMDAFWSGVRSRTGINIMFGNIVNALQQVTGYFPAMLKVKPRYLKSALSVYMGNTQKVTEEVAGLSKFMDDRLHNQMFDMQDAMNDLLLNPSKYEKVQKWAKHHGYFLQSAFQNQVDIVTWIGTYNQTLAEIGAERNDESASKEAVQRADAAVRMTQGSLSPEDVAAFEVGTPFYKTLIQFSGYFNMMANLNSNEFIKIVRDLGWRGNKGKLLMTYVLGFGAPMLVADAIVRSLGGGWDDDDEDGNLDTFMDWFFGSQVKGLAAMVPFGSSLIVPFNAFNDKPYDDKMTTSPSVSTLEGATIGVVKAGINIVSEDKEVSGKNVRDILTLLSLATGIPLTVLGKPIGYQIEVNRGKVEPTSTSDYVRGLITGKASESSKQ